ncbi:MAG: hypothetical protein A3F09_04400 [Chlamydiae bacterium RIFCSPHIGHO2_12_FULL_49_11]|nr:MAG: hypothetical protein A3F09_04400 [Chlamydiae bacterium RIFCSPHIGHO2_12_FULL_49_11]
MGEGLLITDSSNRAYRVTATLNNKPVNLGTFKDNDPRIKKLVEAALRADPGASTYTLTAHTITANNHTSTPTTSDYSETWTKVEHEIPKEDKTTSDSPEPSTVPTQDTVSKDLLFSRPLIPADSVLQQMKQTENEVKKTKTTQEKKRGFDEIERVRRNIQLPKKKTE